MDGELAFPIFLTARVCLFSLLIYLAAVPPLALWLARSRSAAARCAEFVVTLPLIFPPIALGYMLLMVLDRQGLLGSLLWDAFGLRIVFSQAAVVMAAVIAGLPLVVRPLQVAFASERLRGLEEASRVCGAARIRTFFLVTLPLVRNSLLAGLLLGLARASGEVGITLMLGGNIARRTNTLSLEIFNSVSRGDFDAATALCGLLAVFALILYVLLYAVQSKKVF